MSGRGLLLVGLSALLTAVSNLMLRVGITRAGGFALSLKSLGSDLFRLAQQPLFLAGVALYGTAALIWFRIVSTENLSNSYPVLVGMTFVLVTLGATLFLQEPVSWRKVLGLGLIFVGILVVSRA